MKIVTTHEIVSDWRKTFNFTDLEFSVLSVGKLKSLVSQERPESDIELQQYVHNGAFLANDELLISSLLSGSSQAITLQYLLLPKNLNLKIDHISTVAATTWSKENSSSSSTDSHNQVLDRVAQSFTVPAVPVPVAPVEAPIKWFNLAVLVRTIVTCAVYLYTGRGEISYEAKVRTSIAGVILYLLHIGALKMLFKRAFHYAMEKYFRLDRNNEYIDPNPTPVANLAAVGGAPAPAVPVRRLAPEDQLSRRIQEAIDTTLKILKEGITIPKTPGVVYDVLAICVGLVGSLFPRWTADGAPLIEFN